jgi:3',5'-cyclic AMP phosphodiesterase CpdA
MKLWAISDLHVGYADNRRIVERIPPHPGDWLILAGDTSERTEDLRFVLEQLCPRFARVIWVPGNHELWTISSDAGAKRGVAKYQELVELCASYGVLTPEDTYAVFDDGTHRHLVVPLFVLYDYSFCPEGMSPQQALAWAREAGLVCTDEDLLHPTPYPSRSAWCAARCAYSESRLEEALASHDGPTVLVNHFPLLDELARLPRIPRFRIWCGTKRTRDWHRRFRADTVVYGHLHIPSTRIVDGVRFEEVSLGYPMQWFRAPNERGKLRQVLPAPAPSSA